jgi:hypothetical protein
MFPFVPAPETSQQLPLRSVTLAGFRLIVRKISTPMFVSFLRESNDILKPIRCSFENPSISQRIRVYGDTFDPDLLLGSILLVHLNRIHFRQGLHTLISYSFCKYRVLTIQMGRLVEQDEELAIIRTGTLISHADDSSSIVS